VHDLRANVRRLIYGMCNSCDMKSQSLSVDFPLMMGTALMYIGLAAAGWLLLRLIQACFWLPGHLEKRRLKELSNIKNKAAEEKKNEESVKDDSNIVGETSSEEKKSK